MTLFKHILDAIGVRDDYFTQKFDAVENFGLSPSQKMILAVRMLAYDCAADLLNKYVQIGESTATESIKRFCNVAINIFEGQYLRKPNKDDIDQLLAEGEAQGFPGTLNSLDCMYWQWKNCPTAWQGMYTNIFKRVPTFILEIVVSMNLWIWHAFFGMVGLNNDVTVLDRSLLFDNIINNIAPLCQFTIKGHSYNMGYCHSDGIYPRYATLMQTISQPSSIKEKLFAKHQEAVKKDVERAFGVLKSRWHIIKGLARFWNAKDLEKIMKTYIILHNMIIESEHSQGINPENLQSHGKEVAEDVSVDHDYAVLASNMIRRTKQVQDTPVHKDLKTDLINHLWDKYGDTESVEDLRN